MIELDKLSKNLHPEERQREFRAVDSVSLTVEKGEICVFLGPSGCGKTTTLKMINRIIPPTSGRVLIDGQDTADLDEVALRRHIGYVIQQIGLFPNMTIEGKHHGRAAPARLGQGARCKREGPRADEHGQAGAQAVPATLPARNSPAASSASGDPRAGGGRAAAAMDELFGAVDLINRESIQNEFFEMQRKLGMTVIMVSHDIDEAIKLGDKVGCSERPAAQYDHTGHPAGAPGGRVRQRLHQ